MKSLNPPAAFMWNICGDCVCVDDSLWRQREAVPHVHDGHSSLASSCPRREQGSSLTEVYFLVPCEFDKKKKKKKSENLHANDFSSSVMH